MWVKPGIFGRVRPRAEDVGAALQRFYVARQSPRPAGYVLVDQVLVVFDARS